MLCVWSPLGGIANWRRRNPSAWQDSAKGVLLPLREKVAPEGGRMRGREAFVTSPSQADPHDQRDPSSVGFADTFSCKGRRNEIASVRSPLALIASERGVRRLSAVDEECLELGLFFVQKARDTASMVPCPITADPELHAIASTHT